MKAIPRARHFAFDSPATYRISIQGRIPTRWYDCLEGMTITTGPPEADPPVTTLLGDLSDQAALAGVLSTLYELHLPVLSVERVGGDSTTAPSSSP